MKLLSSLKFFSLKTLFGPLIGDTGSSSTGRSSRGGHNWGGNDRWPGGGGPPRGKKIK